MKKALLPFFTLLLLFTLTGCSLFEKRKGEKLTAEQVEKQYGKAVVLIQVQYYYSARLGNLTLWFSGISDDGEMQNVVEEEKDVTKSLAYGTGFFISADGKIATNNHVASPIIDTKTIESRFAALLSYLQQNLHEQINSYTDQIGELHNYWLNAPSGSVEEYEIEQRRSALQQERDELQSTVDKLSTLSAADMQVTLHARLGVAYNNTFVTGSSDFQECVVINSDADHDLAVLQLKGKKLPQDCTFIDITKKAADADDSPVDDQGQPIDVDKIELGTQLYLIGYNLGPALALTQDGVKAQITQGTVSQNTDNVKMMYSIPTLQGSSGSPVLDQYGNFVAVNFAGLNGTQGFNYGIKGKYLRQLLER